MTKATAEYLIEQCSVVADQAQKAASKFATGDGVGIATELEAMRRALYKVAFAVDYQFDKD
jgi:hypothetical protein